MLVREESKEIQYNPVPSCLSKLHSDPTFSIALFSPLVPQTGSGALPEVLKLCGTLLHSEAGPETPCFVSSFHPDPVFSSRFLQLGFTQTLPFLPIRLLEAAELLEADQRKHEGGQNKQTSSVLDSTSFGSAPMIFWSRRLVARPDWP